MLIEWLLKFEYFVTLIMKVDSTKHASKIDHIYGNII